MHLQTEGANFDAVLSKERYSSNYYSFSSGGEKNSVLIQWGDVHVIVNIQQMNLAWVRVRVRG